MNELISYFKDVVKPRSIPEVIYSEDADAVFFQIVDGLHQKKSLVDLLKKLQYNTFF